MTGWRFSVRLADAAVGDLTEEADGSIEFRFRESYRTLPQRHVLGQHFEDDLARVYRGKRQRLPAFFENLIPEPGRLREVLCEAAAIDPGNDLALLGFTGLDLPGAVIIEPSSREPASSPQSESSRTDGSGRDIAESTESAPTERLRFSLAGVQMKFSMLLADEKLTLPGQGETGAWIVKFPSPVYPSLPENEFSMLSWARCAGFEVPACALRPVSTLDGFPRRFSPEGDDVLAIERYDRDGERRIHQEDFAQVCGLPPSKKYDQMTFDSLVFLAQSILGEDGADEALRRLAFMVATGNNDAHLKNWSLLYPDGIQPTWAPLYDQVSTVAWSGDSGRLERALALKLGAVKDFGRIDRGAFERLAAKSQLAEDRVTATVRDTLAHLRDSWDAESASWPLVRRHREALRDHWRRVPILREIGALR